MPLTKTPHLAETVRKLLARDAGANAFNILNRLHPSDIAELFGELPNYRKVAFEILAQKNQSLAGAALSELGPARGGELLAGMSAEEISRVLQELDPDDAAEFVAELPSELQEEILGRHVEKFKAAVTGSPQHCEGAVLLVVDGLDGVHHNPQLCRHRGCLWP